MKNINVAIDGPAASGKSSVAKRVATELNMKYVDTGAMYRTITLHLLNQGIDLNNENEVENNINDIKVDFQGSTVFLNDQDVSEEIRSEQVTNNVSVVSAYNAVRELLTKLQREIADNKNVIMDGRDIGTVVLPDSEVKIFLTASPKVRAMRRVKDFNREVTEEEINQMAEEIAKRDEYDSTREIAPLKQADDATLLDTSDITLEETIQAVKNLIDSAKR